MGRALMPCKRFRPQTPGFASRVFALLLPLALAACEQNMVNQPKYKPLRAAPIFPDGRSAQSPPEGTVAWDTEIEPVPEYSPVAITSALLKRGRERYDIYCSPCHGGVGDGHGMIPERGFPHPPSYHTDRLRKVTDRYLYQVIEHGYGLMFSYGDRVPPKDRWAVIAYIRALQLSQNAGLQDAQEAGVADRLGSPP